MSGPFENISCSCRSSIQSTWIFIVVVSGELGSKFWILMFLKSVNFSGPVSVRHFNSFDCFPTQKLYPGIPRLVINLWTRSRFLHFWESKSVSFHFSIKSILRSSTMSKSISTSDTHRNRCRLSMTTFWRGIVGNSGRRDTLCFLLDLGSWLTLTFSSIVRAPRVGSVMDQCLSTSRRSSVEHLHQIQGYFELALSIPVISARNFQSLPR